jgi:predicted site-specific integrase-resolvase
MENGMKRTNITELARKWGVSRRFVHDALKAGRIPGAEFIDGRWYIPEDAENPIKRLVTPKDGYLSAKEAAEKWGVAKAPVCNAAKEGRIPGAKFVGGRWHIPKDMDNPLKIVMDVKPGYISTKEAAAKWGIGQTVVCNAAKAGRIPGAEFVGNRWHIPEDLDAPEKRKAERKERIECLPGYTSILKTAERWGVSYQHVRQLCEEGRISGAVHQNKHWNIPEDEEQPMPQAVPLGFLSASQIAKKWGVYVNKVTWMCQEGLILDVKRGTKTWLIPQDTVNPLEGYALVSEMAERWGMHRNLVSRACTEGRIPGAKRVGRNWYVPADAEKPLNMKIDRKSGYTSATKAAEKWGTSRSFVCKACREGRIPGAEFIDGKWHIPEDAVWPTK